MQGLRWLPGVEKPIRVQGDLLYGYVLLLRRSAKYRIRNAQEYFKVASGGLEVASELVRDIFEFSDLFFQGKEIITTNK